MNKKMTSIEQGLARTLPTDEEFIASTREACADLIMNTATGQYLDEALKRLEQAIALIDEIKAQVSWWNYSGRIYSMIKEWEKRVSE